MDHRQLNTGIKEYTRHLRDVVAAFNNWAKYCNIPLKMDAGRQIKAIQNGFNLAQIASFCSRSDDTGIVHETQLKTAIDCFVELWKRSTRCGHILGAMQSGKTTTSLALQWAGPVLYQLTGSRVHPFYLIGSQTSHEDQTKTELNQFLNYYGSIEIWRTDTDDNSMVELDALFARSPTLTNYRQEVLRGILADVFTVPQLEDIVHRRVGGDQGVKRVADLCRKATAQGYRPLMIIDEPQYGASDTLIKKGDETVRRPCVLVQIFDRIQHEIGSSRNDHWFVGLSATPFELNDLRRVWEVRQYLTESYSGYNIFSGRPISEGISIKSPTTMSLTDFANYIGIPFFAKLSMQAYEGKVSSFDRYAKKIGYEDTREKYLATTDDSLRLAIQRLLRKYAKDKKWPIGICIRAFNNNNRTKSLIDNLKLDPSKIEVLHYYGSAAKGVSIKRAIARREHPDLPYIIFVTNRARMADAFPVQVRFFMDFGDKAGDLNALLQGLLGRACGYNKRSTVILSDANKEIIDAYVATDGALVHKPSRHSVTVGHLRRSAPIRILKLKREMRDAKIQQFFREIDSLIVKKHIPDGTTILRDNKRSKFDQERGFRTGPILQLAEAMGLFDYLEDANIRLALFSQIPSGFKIARAGDHISGPNSSIIKYQLDSQGYCRYTFRWYDGDAAIQGGIVVKGKSPHLEPAVYVEKLDPKTRRAIYDRSATVEKRCPGNWRTFMITFPLLEPVREVHPANIAFPNELCAYDYQMEQDERDIRDKQKTTSKKGQRLPR